MCGFGRPGRDATTKRPQTGPVESAGAVVDESGASVTNPRQGKITRSPLGEKWLREAMEKQNKKK